MASGSMSVCLYSCWQRIESFPFFFREAVSELFNPLVQIHACTLFAWSGGQPRYGAVGNAASVLCGSDNVKIAYNMHVKYTLGEAIARVGRYFSEEDEITKKALELLKIFKLEDKAYETAKNLPYGEQRRLEIARALATEPKLLLLDEPAAGMNPQETKELMEMIRWIRDKFSLSILLIEHDMGLVMGVCERIYVLEYGFCIASGTPDEIKNNKRVIEAYLGEEVS